MPNILHIEIDMCISTLSHIGSVSVPYASASFLPSCFRIGKIKFQTLICVCAWYFSFSVIQNILYFKPSRKENKHIDFIRPVCYQCQFIHASNRWYDRYWRVNRVNSIENFFVCRIKIEQKQKSNMISMMEIWFFVSFLLFGARCLLGLESQRHNFA